MTKDRPEGRDEVRRDFDQAVNLTQAELRRWLDTEESRSVGDSGGEGESTGHRMGRRILELRDTPVDDHTADDVAAMRKVVGYVRRHLAQRPGKESIEDSRWRYSLMNWGHDPLKE
jgi:hypothetical protein